nr:hypothetical protein [Actinomycetota bacterium]
LPGGAGVGERRGAAWGWATERPEPRPHRQGPTKAVWVVTLPLRAVAALVVDVVFLAAMVCGFAGGAGTAVADVLIRKRRMGEAVRLLFVSFPVGVGLQTANLTLWCLGLRSRPGHRG